MIIFLFFRLKRTALCRRTRQLNYDNCKIDWQCVYIRQGLINSSHVCWMFSFMSVHMAFLLCLSHSSQHDKMIFFTNISNHSLVCAQNTTSNACASFSSHVWWRFTQVRHCIFTNMFGFLWAGLYFIAVTSTRYVLVPRFHNCAESWHYILEALQCTESSFHFAK